MGGSGFKVRGLGEIAIRCADIDAMVDFYHSVLGLNILSDGREESGIVFFGLENGAVGHTCVLALFRNDAGRAELHPRSSNAPVTGADSSLHHIALSLEPAEQEKAIAVYERLGIAHRIQQFDWIGWRGVFTLDPEGNTVELVAFDKDWLATD